MDVSQTIISLFLVLGCALHLSPRFCFWLSDFLLCDLIQSLSFDFHDGGVPHMNTYAYICRVTCESRSSVVFSEAMVIGVGLGVCMPLSTHRWMSMGRVGQQMEGASIPQLGDLRVQRVDEVRKL